MFSIEHLFEYLVPSQWNCLGRIWKYDFLEGGVSWGMGVGLKVSKLILFPVNSLPLSLLHLYGSDESSQPVLVSCLICVVL